LRRLILVKAPADRNRATVMASTAFRRERVDRVVFTLGGAYPAMQRLVCEFES
jgi:hypothetical protein